MDKHPAPLVQTPRLTLRELGPGDTDLIVSWRSEPSVYRYFLSPHPLTAAEHNSWYTQRYLHNPDRYDWIAVAGSLPVGVFGLIRQGNVAEVNYLLAPDAQHRGYAAEAVTALLDWARCNWHVQYALAEIHRENQPSLHFAASLGFELTGERGDFLLYRRAL